MKRMKRIVLNEKKKLIFFYKKKEKKLEKKVRIYEQQVKSRVSSVSSVSSSCFWLKSSVADALQMRFIRFIKLLRLDFKKQTYIFKTKI
jgi:hypothetical protein